MPSANPTWAKAGVAMMSPMAYTCGSPVRQYSSTSMNPRLADHDARLCETQLVGVRAPPDGHDDDVHLDRFAFAEMNGRAGAFGYWGMDRSP
jgi:hypothetical protein